ncbi:MAG: alpha-L-fucosidase, partial [Bacteroidetes bacterium]|nr:alpha-L-fucosidase [Bacteroidota bacterium]
MTFFSSSFAQEIKTNDEKMQWFQEAKLGIFIHWGIYSVNGIAESWSFFNNYISHDNYMKQLQGFTARNYQPNLWVEQIKNSGAKYAVITTKHHDGVALWDSKAPQSTTIAKNAKAQKDVLTPFVQSLKKSGLKTGLYFSLPDWSYPNYDIETKTNKRYNLLQNPERWNLFTSYYQQQLKELSTRYQPDLYWFDGDWEHNAQEWKSKETLQQLQQHNPNIIINSRLNHFGDYETPEQGIPVIAPASKYWELCYTMNDSWGYQPYDLHYKSPNMIVRTLADVVAMGGNLLLDIGPKEDGTIPEQQIDILKNLGKWTSKYPNAIYKTKRGIETEYFKGKSAISSDDKHLFLYLEEKKSVAYLYGIQSKISQVRTADINHEKIPFTQDNLGNVQLDISSINFDPDVTVLDLEFHEPLSLFSTLPKTTTALSRILQNKNTQQAVYQLAYELDKGNNLLDNSGISADGNIAHLPKFENENSETRQWISKNAEALTNTQKGLPSGHYSGMSALSQDKQTLYLFVEGNPTGPIAIKGLKNSISRIRIVGEGTMLSHDIFNKMYWSPIPGIVYIDIPKDR